LTTDRNLHLDPALSADGKKLVYAADGGRGSLDIWVQDTAGGDPVRVTSGSADHREPVISPDGLRVVFRSEEQNGGLWELAVGSSEPPKRFSKEGRQPRFSPDGSRLAFWVPGTPNSPIEPVSSLFFGPHGSVRALQHGLIFCTDPNTFKVRLLPLTLAAAGLPAWSPDGRYIVVYGAAEMNPFRQEDPDWWVVSTATTVTPFKPIRTGIVPQLRRIGVDPVLYPPAWVGGKLYFSARSGQTVDLWQAQLSDRTHQVEGPLRKVTLGSGAALNPTASASRNLAISIVSGDVNVWALPVDANRGVPTGKLKRITAGALPNFWSSVSADGRRVAFSSQRFGLLSLFAKDLRTGTERRVADAAEQPRISPDGSQIVFSRPEKATAAVYLVGASGGNASRVVSDAGEVAGWSADGRSIIYDRGSHLHGHLLHLNPKKDDEFARHPVEDSFLESLSPDQNWVTLICQGKLYIAAIAGGTAAPDDQWIQVTDGSDRVDRARWSPDGNLLYFISNRDGHRCIWAQHLAVDSRKPVGAAVAAYHFHDAGPSLDHLSPEVLSFDVSADKLVFALGEFNSTVFLLRQ
jgi:Tol biopolymer transport system component